jgi:pimeloyl-ACP methyl ester carboxylesterase
MDVILIPGFWLDGSSWGEVVPALEGAGHRVQALTLPGLESVAADRRGIGLADHVAAAVAAVDAGAGPVVIVGHSGGGAVAQGVADARPDRVARVVFVDAGPIPVGQAVNDQLPVVDGECPLPDWSFFEEPDLVDLDDGLRESLRARSVPEPRGVAYDPVVLGDERRLDVPVTVICCSLTSAQLQEWVAQGSPYLAELAAVRDVDYVDLPTGHWPQLTRPGPLAEAIAAAVAHS